MVLSSPSVSRDGRRCNATFRSKLQRLAITGEHVRGCKLRTDGGSSPARIGMCRACMALSVQRRPRHQCARCGSRLGEQGMCSLSGQNEAQMARQGKQVVAGKVTSASLAAWRTVGGRDLAGRRSAGVRIARYGSGEGGVRFRPWSPGLLAAGNMSREMGYVFERIVALSALGWCSVRRRLKGAGWVCLWRRPGAWLRGWWRRKRRRGALLVLSRAGNSPTEI